MPPSGKSGKHNVASMRSRAQLAHPELLFRPKARFGSVASNVRSRRSFIANPGCPLTTGQLLKRAYPRQQRYQHWQYAQVRLSAERFAQRVGVARDRRGKPVLWAPREGK